jgi:RNA polymerase sigma-70 factor (ECF subfamily)
MEKTRHVQMAWSSYSEQTAPTPEEKMVARDEEQKHAELLTARISALPPRQKELIMLRFYEGRSYEEIADKTGLTHRTVYNSIFEAIKKLKLDFSKKADIYGTALSVILLCNSSIA